jgi:acyl-CoA hydrolase
MQGKPVSESISECAELALPTDANGLGNVLGGKVMHPVHIGDLITLRSSVNRVFRTSMEVGVTVETENLMTGAKLHTCSAYLTFVALDETGKAVPIPPVIPETETEKRRYREAGERREGRLAMRRREMA